MTVVINGPSGFGGGCCGYVQYLWRWFGGFGDIFDSLIRRQPVVVAVLQPARGSDMGIRLSLCFGRSCSMTFKDYLSV